MGIYKICPRCGAHLDPGESCDCIEARYDTLTQASRDRVDAFIMELIAEQRASTGR